MTTLNFIAKESSDIHHLVHPETDHLQEAAQQIGEEEGAEVADGGEVVYCRAAGVHGHARWGERLEFFGAVGQRIVEANIHGDSG